MIVILKITLPITLSVYVNRIFFFSKSFHMWNETFLFLLSQMFLLWIQLSIKSSPTFTKIPRKMVLHTFRSFRSLNIFFFSFLFLPNLPNDRQQRTYGQDSRGSQHLRNVCDFLLPLALLCASYNIPVYYKSPITVLYSSWCTVSLFYSRINMFGVILS